MDTISIHDLEVFFRVGVPDAERAQPQRLLLTIHVGHDLTMAVERDDVRWTIDYGALCDRIARFGESRAWQLIETLATEIADMIQREFGAVRVSVEVKKFILPQTNYVSVRVTRPPEM